MSSRKQWAKHFLAMGIDEEQMMAMGETEFQNMKDYIEFNDIQPQNDEDEAAAEELLLKKLKEKKKAQQQNPPKPKGRRILTEQEAEDLKIRREQDKEYMKEVEKQLKLQAEKNLQNQDSNQTENTEQIKTYFQLELEPEIGVTIMVRMFNTRIMRKFHPDKDGFQVKLWVAFELLKFGNSQPFDLLLPTGKLFDPSLTLASQGITANTVLNLSQN